MGGLTSDVTSGEPVLSILVLRARLLELARPELPLFDALCILEDALQGIAKKTGIALTLLQVCNLPVWLGAASSA